MFLFKIILRNECKRVEVFRHGDTALKAIAECLNQYPKAELITYSLVKQSASSVKLKCNICHKDECSL